MKSALLFTTTQEVLSAAGRELYLSHWVSVDQRRIDQFADATGDFQWIHLDVERAKVSPFGGTIAHGFLSLSLIGGLYEPYLQQALPFCDIGVNYGLNRVRFTSPVRTGSNVRCRFMLAKAEEVADGLQLTCNVTMEVEHQNRPALVAETLIRRHYKRV